MNNQSVFELLKSLDSTIKLTLGAWGCLVAPLMIWTGTVLLILSTLGINLQVANQTFLGLQLLLAGVFWELVICFTFEPI